MIGAVAPPAFNCGRGRLAHAAWVHAAGHVLDAHGHRQLANRAPMPPTPRPHAIWPWSAECLGCRCPRPHSVRPDCQWRTERPAADAQIASCLALCALSAMPPTPKTNRHSVDCLRRTERRGRRGPRCDGAWLPPAMSMGQAAAGSWPCTGRGPVAMARWRRSQAAPDTARHGARKRQVDACPLGMCSLSRPRSPGRTAQRAAGHTRTGRRSPSAWAAGARMRLRHDPVHRGSRRSGRPDRARDAALCRMSASERIWCGINAFDFSNTTRSGERRRGGRTRSPCRWVLRRRRWSRRSPSRWRRGARRGRAPSR